MTIRAENNGYSYLTSVALCIFIGINAAGQDIPEGNAEKSHHFFDGILLEEEDEKAAEVLKDLLDIWIESPLNVNSDQVAQLAEYGLISQYQWNKLREYRLMYGDMVSVYELKHVGGWDLQTAQRVAPYLSTEGSENIIPKFSLPANDIKHQLVVKTAIIPQIRKGYQEIAVSDTLMQSHYLGSPLKVSLRYDLAVRKSIRFGIRSEKDPGEPYLVKNEFFEGCYQGPDHLSAFLQFNFRGLVKTLVLGDYRLAFGYGLNYSGGNRMFGNRDGLTQPAGRLLPNTSMSESGYLRGASIYLRQGRLNLTIFGSRLKSDATSPEIDSLTGDAISVSGISSSGLHRTSNELAQRKMLTENIYGGTFAVSNDWVKAGFICYYNHFSEPIRAKTEPYAKFDFHGSSNLVSGLTLAALLRNIRFISEASMSRNGGFAFIAGTEAAPDNGIRISLIFRHYNLQYQNIHGAGYSSSSNNNNETGLQSIIRIETPWRWIFHLTTDASRSGWVTYQIKAPSNKWYVILSADRTWRDIGSFFISAKYQEETAADPLKSAWIVHPGKESRFSFRIEGRLMVSEILTFKSRIEMNSFALNGNYRQQGYLILQDIGYSPKRFPLHFWMRICLFLSESYSTRIYAYENDVMYDFSSFMHDGKGLRNVWMLRYSPWDWLDCWIRLASVIYRDRSYIGSDWDRAEGSRLDEIEVQIRLKLQHQYNFSRFKR